MAYHLRGIVLPDDEERDLYAVASRTSRNGADRSSATRNVCAAILASVLLTQMAAAMLLSASGDAPTIDEPAHLAAGTAYVFRHDLRLNPEHPPLVKVLAALPLRLAGINLPTPAQLRSEGQYTLGRRILYGMGNDPGHVMWLARLPMMGLTLGLALVVFAFARDLFGTWPALVALAVTTLDPNLIANGRLLTTDVAVTGFLLLTLWLLWRAANRARPWVLAAGIALGLGMASKYSALVAVPFVALVAFSSGWSTARPASRFRRLLEGLGWSLVVLVLALVTVWAVYLAIDPRLRFDGARLEATGALASVAERLPVPEAYRAGLEFAIASDQGGRDSYLLGEHYKRGRLDYYPLLLAIKTPVGTLALWAAALTAVLATRRRRELGMYLLLVPAALLLFAVQSDTNMGYRHILVVPVFLAVASAAVVTARRRREWVFASVLLLATALSVWRTFPAYLAYANEPAGGPANAYRLVTGSNVDWAQDLGRLAAYLQRNHPHDRVWLLYAGTALPSAYGIRANNLALVPPEQADGIVAASVTSMNGRWYATSRDFIRCGQRPLAQVGHSILVYRVKHPSCPAG